MAVFRILLFRSKMMEERIRLVCLFVFSIRKLAYVYNSFPSLTNSQTYQNSLDVVTCGPENFK